MKHVIQSFLLAASLLLSSALQSHTNHIPEQIVAWSERNVWSVATQGGNGSGFFLSPDIFISACHVMRRTEANVDGEPMIFAVNMKDTQFLQLHLRICDKTSDIAVLTLHEDSEVPDIDVTELVTEMPRQGTTVWGAGYPMDLNLTITQGHIQRPASRNFKEGGWIITSPTIMGDSGSPVLILEDGEVKVIGVRLAIKGVPQGHGFARFSSFLPHLTIMGPGSNVQKAIIEGTKQ